MLNTFPNSQHAIARTNGKLSGRAGREDGYLLIGVLFLVAMVLITLAVAAPKVASEIQRDKELELYHRGLQYQQAIRMYYKKFGRYPNSLEQLEKTNEIRFLRKRYKDPVTGKDEWRMIHFGEQKVKTTGLFGQALAATGTNGLSSGTNTGTGGTSGSAFGSNSGSAFGSNSGSAFGSNSGSAFGSNSGSAFGSNSGSAFGSNSGSAFGSPVGSNSPIGTPTGTSSPTGTATGATGTSTAGTGGTGSSDPTAANGTGLAGASTSGISSIGNGQTFGGGGIVGVSSSSKKASIREYRKQKHYNEWEFVYDPASETTNIAGASQQNGNTNQNGSFGGGGFGSSSGGFGSNSSSGGFGSSNSPTSPTTPTQPTQPTTPAPQQ